MADGRKRSINQPQDAFRRWVSALVCHGSGAFWVHTDEHGDTQYSTGFGRAQKVDFDTHAQPAWFTTDFKGKSFETYTWTFHTENRAPDFEPADMSQWDTKDFQVNSQHVTATNKTMFIHGVDRLQAEARAGNIWVANMTHQIQGKMDSPWGALTLFDAFLGTPGPYTAGVLWTPEHTLVSFSPELFISHEGAQITTRPIKGTGTKEYLDTSTKEQAELDMVTDLLRNDLSIICTRVDTPVRRALFARGSFYHAYSEITGTLPTPILRKEDYLKLLPAGSISGAPKSFVVNTLSEIESSPRGLYTGTFGYRPHPEKTTASILIRTLFLDRPQGRWSYGVGGGITHKSDPEAEWTETLEKATILTRLRDA